MKKISWILLPVLSFFVIACNTSKVKDTIPAPLPIENQDTNNEVTDIQKIQNIHWVSSHEESVEGWEAYRKEGYSFPLSRGPRCGFTIQENGQFIHESIHPADAGCIQQQGTWKSTKDNEIQIDLRSIEFEQFKYGPRSYIFEYKLEAGVLKTKTTKDSMANDPDENSGKLIAELGENFSIYQGETAQVKNEKVSLTLTGFINSPCPAGTQCIWSGQQVHYELDVDGKKYGIGKNLSLENSPYTVAIVESDYEKSAVMKIEKSL